MLFQVACGVSEPSRQPRVLVADGEGGGGKEEEEVDESEWLAPVHYAVRAADEAASVVP